MKTTIINDKSREVLVVKVGHRREFINKNGRFESRLITSGHKTEDNETNHT